MSRSAVADAARGDGREVRAEAHGVAPREQAERRDERPAAEPREGPCRSGRPGRRTCACDRYYSTTCLRTDPRIVISGIGVVSCFGVGRERFWDARQPRAERHARASTEFDVSTFPCQVAAPVPPVTIADATAARRRRRRRRRVTRRSEALLARGAARRHRGARGVERRGPAGRRAERRRPHRQRRRRHRRRRGAVPRLLHAGAASTSRRTPSPSGSSG